MAAYKVTYKCIDECSDRVIDIIQVFYSDSPQDLCEQMLEYEEDMDATTNLIVIEKVIKEIK